MHACHAACSVHTRRHAAHGRTRGFDPFASECDIHNGYSGSDRCQTHNYKQNAIRTFRQVKSSIGRPDTLLSSRRKAFTLLCRFVRSTHSAVSADLTRCPEADVKHSQILNSVHISTHHTRDALPRHDDTPTPRDQMYSNQLFDVSVALAVQHAHISRTHETRCPNTMTRQLQIKSIV